MSWMLLGHRSEFANPGDYILLSAGGEQTLAYNHDGTIIVSDNLCLHRGSRIFSKAFGNAPLKCPYHGFEGERVQKGQTLTAWVGNWLFAGDGSSKLEDDLGKLHPALADLSDKISARHAFDVLPMSCNWQAAVENTLEDLHIPTVHQDTFGKLDLRLDGMTQFGHNSMAAYTIGDERTVRGLTAIGKHFLDVQPESYFHIYLWPGVCISSAGGLTFSVQHYLPSGGFTMLHSRLYRAKMRPEAPSLGYFFDEAADFNRRVFQQDAVACARVVGSGTFLTEKEERIKWFRTATK